ncbi:unnamed protein product [Somion occarium]|uniref:RecF/RecN/SMC N-terminal domain-containing protein n=1 Tax=Somion occarium TaxID=3059160 RepID=A0ABP1DZW1_9APHY
MAKRRATRNDSDTEDLEEGHQASKRARTSSSNDEEPGEARNRNGRDPKGKGKDRDKDDGDLDIDGEDQVEQIVLDEDEEKRFEEEHEEQIRAKVLGKKKQAQGGAAEMGIIESLELHQFMCHKYLTFKFGPQINFIIGHNGSGKSAVLSALTVALGGKANTTGRGSGLKSFIREGENAAEVTVVIKNQGEEAYKHKEYGDSIVITRRFTREGSSSYKIKSRDGRIISTKREELSAICDHMNIQVDNPMNILTQDSARQFLSASQPTDKYKFFLRGTQLSQLSEEYSTCLENITQTGKVLVHKSEAIPDLEDALEEATARFQEAKKAREQKHKADELKKELAWAHVAAKEGELTAKLEEHTKLQRRAQKVEKSIKESADKIEKTEKVVAEREQELDDLGQIDNLLNRRAELQAAMKANKAELSSFREEERSMNTNLQNANRSIAELTRKIAEEQKRMESLTQGKREETHRKLNEAQINFKAADDRVKELQTRKGELDADVQRTGAEGQRLTQERNGLRERIVAIDQQLELCSQREKNKLATFGRNMESVMQEIQMTQWRGEQPVGPFGQYVKVRDAHKWAPLLRVTLGQAMSAWAVTNSYDRQVLAKILKKNGNDPSIYVADVDLFDYSKGEPPEDLLTVLRALEVSNPFVLRLLINSSRIESTILAQSRQDAERLLHQYNITGNAWAAELYNVQRYRDGGIRSTTLRQLSNADPRMQLWGNANVEADKRKFQQEKIKLQQQHGEFAEQIKNAQDAYNKAQRDLQEWKKQCEAAVREARRAKDLRDRLQEDANEEEPVEIQTLQDALRDAEADKESTMNQFKELTTRKEAINEAQKPLMAELETLRRQVDEFEGRRTAIEGSIEEAVTLRLKAQNEKAHYEKKLAEAMEQVNASQTVVDQLQEEFTTWTGKAEEYCERFPNPRKVADVQRNLDSVQNALKEREKRDGATVEEMTVEVNKKKAALETAENELKNMALLNKALRRSIKVRLLKWHEFRRHIALRCKIYFAYHLSQRGYYGKVLFDHVSQSLQLKVQTDDMVPTQGGNREKDPRSLSGGEKSFSTICLLLSLWESIGCPIRCLDEFDVFMDAVNRRISMKMMIDTANASNRKQYILITPQDMSNITIGPSVRVLRMSDPERNQGVLAFQ